MAHCISQLPVAMMSTKSASISKHLGHRLAHQRRRIVELHQQRAFGGGAIVRGQIRNQPGPRQSPRCLCPLACRSGPYPTDELPNDHCPSEPTQPVKTTP
jgi:hypothetical protein